MSLGRKVGYGQIGAKRVPKRQAIALLKMRSRLWLNVFVPASPAAFFDVKQREPRQQPAR